MGAFIFLVYPTIAILANVNADHEMGNSFRRKHSRLPAVSSVGRTLAQCASSPAFKQAFLQRQLQYLSESQLGWFFLVKRIIGGPSGGRRRINRAAYGQKIRPITGDGVFLI